MEDGRVENVKGDFKERRELGIPGREDILRKEEIKREDKEEYQKIILRDGRILVKKTRRYEGFGDGRDMGKDRLTKWERERIGSKFIFHIGSRVRVSETAYEKREKNGEEIEEIYVEMRNEEDGILKKIEPGHMRIDNAVEIGELLFLDLVLGCTNRGDVGLDRNQMSIDQEGVIHAMGRRMSLDRMYRFLIEDRDKDLEYLKGDGALLIMKKYEDIIKNIVKDFIEEKSEFLEEGIFKREDFEIFNYQVGRKVFRGEEIKRKIYEGFIIGMRNFHNKYDKRWLRIEGIESKVAEEIEIFEEIYEGIKGVILKELIERERIEIKLEGGKKKRVRVYQDIYLRREEVYGEGGEIEEKIFFNKEGDIERREILDKRGEVIIATKYSADKKKEEYVNGVLEKVTEYEGGIVKKEEKYDAKGGFVRKRTLYDGEGKKGIEEEYKGERKISERKYKEGGNKREGYDERGNVISLVKYDREWKKEGEAYWAWEEGEILAHIGMVLGLKEERRKVEGMYHEDEKEGEWRYYNRHGELVKEIRWEKGEIKEEKNKKAVRGVLQWEDEEGIERHEEVKTFINGRNFSKLEIFQDIVGKRGYRGGNKAEEEVNIERIELRGGREVIRKSRIRKQERGVAAKDLNFDKERLKREEIATRIMKYILRSTDAPNAKYVIGEERGELIEELYIEQMIREVDFKFEVEKISVSAGHLVQIGEIMFVDMLLGNRRRLWEGCNTKDMLNDGERIFPINTTFSKEGMMATVSESGKDKKNHEYLKDLKDIMIKVIGEYSQEGKSKYLEGRITSNSAFKEVLELISLNYDLGILMKEITEGFIIGMGSVANNYSGLLFLEEGTWHEESFMEEINEMNQVFEEALKVFEENRTEAVNRMLRRKEIGIDVGEKLKTQSWEQEHRVVKEIDKKEGVKKKRRTKLKEPEEEEIRQNILVKERNPIRAEYGYKRMLILKRGAKMVVKEDNVGREGRKNELEKEEKATLFIREHASRVRAPNVLYQEEEQKEIGKGEKKAQLFLEYIEGKRGDMEKLSRNASLNNLVELGELMFFDLIMGNINRIIKGVNKKEIVVDKEGVYNGIGNKLDIEKLYQYLTGGKQDIRYIGDRGYLDIVEHLKKIIRVSISEYKHHKRSSFFYGEVYKGKGMKEWILQVEGKIRIEEELIIKHIFKGFIIGMQSFNSFYGEDSIREETEEEIIFRKIYKLIQEEIEREMKEDVKKQLEMKMLRKDNILYCETGEWIEGINEKEGRREITYLEGKKIAERRYNFDLELDGEIEKIYEEEKTITLYKEGRKIFEKTYDEEGKQTGAYKKYYDTKENRLERLSYYEEGVERDIVREYAEDGNETSKRLQKRRMMEYKTQIIGEEEIEKPIYEEDKIHVEVTKITLKDKRIIIKKKEVGYVKREAEGGDLQREEIVSILMCNILRKAKGIRGYYEFKRNLGEGELLFLIPEEVGYKKERGGRYRGDEYIQLGEIIIMALLTGGLDGLLIGGGIKSKIGIDDKRKLHVQGIGMSIGKVYRKIMKKDWDRNSSYKIFLLRLGEVLKDLISSYMNNKEHFLVQGIEDLDILETETQEGKAKALKYIHAGMIYGLYSIEEKYDDKLIEKLGSSKQINATINEDLDLLRKIYKKARDIVREMTVVGIGIEMEEASRTKEEKRIVREFREEIVELGGSKYKEETYITEEGKYDGKYRLTQLEGKIEIEGRYKEGKPVGEWIKRYGVNQEERKKYEEAESMEEEIEIGEGKNRIIRNEIQLVIGSNNMEEEAYNKLHKEGIKIEGEEIKYNLFFDEEEGIRIMLRQEGLTSDQTEGTIQELEKQGYIRREGSKLELTKRYEKEVKVKENLEIRNKEVRKEMVFEALRRYEERKKGETELITGDIKDVKKWRELREYIKTSKLEVRSILLVGDAVNIWILNQDTFEIISIIKGILSLDGKLIIAKREMTGRSRLIGRDNPLIDRFETYRGKGWIEIKDDGGLKYALTRIGKEQMIEQINAEETEGKNLDMLANRNRYVNKEGKTIYPSEEDKYIVFDTLVGIIKRKDLLGWKEVKEHVGDGSSQYMKGGYVVFKKGEALPLPSRGDNKDPYTIYDLLMDTFNEKEPKAWDQSNKYEGSYDKKQNGGYIISSIEQDATLTQSVQKNKTLSTKSLDQKTIRTLNLIFSTFQEELLFMLDKIPVEDNKNYLITVSKDVLGHADFLLQKINDKNFIENQVEDIFKLTVLELLKIQKIAFLLISQKITPNIRQKLCNTPGNGCFLASFIELFLPSSLALNMHEIYKNENITDLIKKRKQSFAKILDLIFTLDDSIKKKIFKALFFDHHNIIEGGLQRKTVDTIYQDIFSFQEKMLQLIKDFQTKNDHLSLTFLNDLVQRRQTSTSLQQDDAMANFIVFSGLFASAATFSLFPDVLLYPMQICQYCGFPHKEANINALEYFKSSGVISNSGWQNIQCPLFLLKNRNFFSKNMHLIEENEFEKYLDATKDSSKYKIGKKEQTIKELKKDIMQRWHDEVVGKSLPVDQLSVLLFQSLEDFIQMHSYNYIRENRRSLWQYTFFGASQFNENLLGTKEEYHLENFFQNDTLHMDVRSVAVVTSTGLAGHYWGYIKGHDGKWQLYGNIGATNGTEVSWSTNHQGRENVIHGMWTGNRAMWTYEVREQDKYKQFVSDNLHVMMQESFPFYGFFQYIDCCTYRPMIKLENNFRFNRFNIQRKDNFFKSTFKNNSPVLLQKHSIPSTNIYKGGVERESLVIFGQDIKEFKDLIQILITENMVTIDLESTVVFDREQLRILYHDESFDQKQTRYLVLPSITEANMNKNIIIIGDFIDNGNLLAWMSYYTSFFAGRQEEFSVKLLLSLDEIDTLIKDPSKHKKDPNYWMIHHLLKLQYISLFHVEYDTWFSLIGVPAESGFKDVNKYFRQPLSFKTLKNKNLISILKMSRIASDYNILFLRSYESKVLNLQEKLNINFSILLESHDQSIFKKISSIIGKKAKGQSMYSVYNNERYEESYISFSGEKGKKPHAIALKQIQEGTKKSLVAGEFFNNLGVKGGKKALDQEKKEVDIGFIYDGILYDKKISFRWREGGGTEVKIYLDEKEISKGGFNEAERKEGRWEEYDFRTGEKKKETNWKEGKIEWEVEYRKGVREGVFKKYLKGGEMEEEGEYKAGEKVGRWETHAKGEIFVGTYKAGKKILKGKLNKRGKEEGRWEEYDFRTGEKTKEIYWIDGRKVLEVGYKNNKRSGGYVTYYAKGEEKQVGRYEAGEKVGKWIEYDERGNIRIEWEYEDGKKEGEQKEVQYLLNGRKIEITEKYTNGVIGWKKETHSQNVMEEFYIFLEVETMYEAGVPKEERRYAYKEGERYLQLLSSGYQESKNQYRNEREYDKEGKEIEKNLKEQVLKEEGTLGIKKTLNGVGIEAGRVLEGRYQEIWEEDKVMKEVEYKEGKKHGEEIIYDEDGGIRRKTEYKEGIKDGKEIEKRKGNITRQTTYIAGEKEGLEVIYYTNGKEKRISWYQEGILHGVVIEWYEDGIEKQKTYWKNGKKHGVSIKRDKEGNIRRKTYYNQSVKVNTEYDITGDIVKIEKLGIEASMRELIAKIEVAEESKTQQ